MKLYLLVILLLLTLSSQLLALRINTNIPGQNPPSNNKGADVAIWEEVSNLFDEVNDTIGSSTRTPLVRCRNLNIDRTLATGSVKDINGKDIEITIVTRDYAYELFAQMAAQQHIPFKYPEDGCYARAHEMSRLLDGEGIVTGKTFIEGDLRVETENSPKGYVEWWYHVAPIIKVKGENGGDDQVYVLDPSIFQRPVPVEEWFRIQTAHQGGRQDEVYQTRRFNYTPNDKSRDMKKYSSSDIESMQDTMRQYMEQQRERE
jgi:hypothetical protein